MRRISAFIILVAILVLMAVQFGPQLVLTNERPTARHALTGAS